MGGQIVILDFGNHYSVACNNVNGIILEYDGRRIVMQFGDWLELRKDK